VEIQKKKTVSIYLLDVPMSSSIANHTLCSLSYAFSFLHPAASIRFGIWGVVNPVHEIFDSKISDFPDKFLIFQATFALNSPFSANIHL